MEKMVGGSSQMEEGRENVSEEAFPCRFVQPSRVFASPKLRRMFVPQVALVSCVL